MDVFGVNWSAAAAANAATVSYEESSIGPRTRPHRVLVHSFIHLFKWAYVCLSRRIRVIVYYVLNSYTIIVSCPPRRKGTKRVSNPSLSLVRSVTRSSFIHSSHSSQQYHVTLSQRWLNFGDNELAEIVSIGNLITIKFFACCNCKVRVLFIYSPLRGLGTKNMITWFRPLLLYSFVSTVNGIPISDQWNPSNRIPQVLPYNNHN